MTVAERHVIAHVPERLDAAEAVATIDGFLTALPVPPRRGARARRARRCSSTAHPATVGSAAVQLAKHLGATVVGVCSAGHAPLVASLGADRVIDYAREDFAEARGALRRDLRRGRQAHVRAVPRGADASTASTSRRCRRPRSCCRRSLTKLFGRGRRAAIAFTGLRPDEDKAGELPLLVDLLESGAMVPVIDRVVPSPTSSRRTAGSTAGTRPASVVVALSPALRPTGAAS